MSHFKAKKDKIRFPASVRSFVRPSVCVLDEFDTYPVIGARYARSIGYRTG